MLEFTTESVAAVLKTPMAGASGPVTGVSTDSRTIRPGDCFFAIAGENFDGHQYVTRAFAQGATCAVVNADAEGLAEINGPLLRVPDTIAALGELAGAYRKTRPFKVVAITGSVGKTTTRQIVHHVLNRHFRAHQAKKNFNNTIGLPLTLLEADLDDEVIVAELGANQPGEIAYLTRIAQPDVVVVTNVHPAHLAGFGNLNTIIKEKTSIAEGLAADGVFIVNGDIGALTEACHAGARAFKTFGRSPDCDYRAEQIVHEGLTSAFTIDGTRVHLPLPGPGNVDNAAAAWAVCAAFGLEVTDFAKALASLPPVSMRAEPIQIGTLMVLNDCYNASPASMNNALATLSNLRLHSPGHERRVTGDGSPRLVFICGAMAELGDQSESLHAELGRAVARARVDLLVTVGEATQATAQAAREANPSHLQSEHFDNTVALCDRLQQLLREYDIILVKGSRTAQLENVVEKLRESVARGPCPVPGDTSDGTRATGHE